MKTVLKKNQILFMSVLIVALSALIAGPCFADGPMMKIEPKGNKKITIGVIDPNAGIEVAAQFNKRHRAEAERRGWDIRFVDLKDNIPQAGTNMENMITAGYDGIILHWMPLRVIDRQIKMAFDKGIPVISLISQGARTPGIIADIGFMEGTHGAMLAEYLGNRLQAGDKVVTASIPMLEKHETQMIGFKGVADGYKLNIVQDLQFQFSGDPFQWIYDGITNILLADSKKEIKGIYSTTDIFGVTAARAAHDRGRDDLLVVTSDDSAHVYKEMPRLPALQAVVAVSIHEKKMNDRAFDIFHAVFKGESVVSQKWYPTLGSLMTRSTLPPEGYVYDSSGRYNEREPDFKAK